MRIGTAPDAAVVSTTDTHVTQLLLLPRSLNLGGAERQLVELAVQLHRRGLAVVVVPFYGDGPLREPLESAGVEIRPLNKRGRWDVVGFGARLRRTVHTLQPEVVYSFLPGPNLVALVAKMLGPKLRVVWGIRSSKMDTEQRDWLGRLVNRVESAGARLVDSIVCNSEAAGRYALSRGFPEDKLTIVYNGIDTDRFRPSAAARAKIRETWGFDERTRVIGLLGRLHPMKDHFTFLRAAAALAEGNPDVRFVCVGGGLPNYADELRRLSDSLGLAGRVLWAGPRSDTKHVYNGFDVATLSSLSESFPNVVAEAMASGVPCVVTDVGDAAEIVGDTGIVVPPKDPLRLADGWLRMFDSLRTDRISLAERARARIEDRFSLDRMVDRTLDALGLQIEQRPVCDR